MKKTTLLTMVAAGWVLLSSSPASANWVHFSDSIFDALGETIKHPARIERIIVLPTDASGSLVEVCIGYVNNVEDDDRGKVTGTVTLFASDDTVIDKVNLSGPVRNGTFGACKEVDSLDKGTMLVFEFRFKKFARMRDTDRFQVAAAVAVDGANPFSRQAGPLSSADQDGIAKMAEWAESGRGVALRREAGGWTVDWRIDGQGFDLGRTYKTIAAAIAAWCDRI